MIGRTNCTQKSGSPSEFVNIQMLTNQAEHSNLNGAVLTMSYETYSKQYTWDGSEITFSVPAHVSCTIEFPEVEGYKKPDNITFVAVEGNSRTIEVEYKAELVKVNVTSSNGSAVSGAKITINGKQQTWNGTEIRQLVPFGTQYSVVAGTVSGFGTPSVQTFTAQNPEREVSVVYIASSLKVNILSNQGTDAAIADVKVTVTYGDTSVEVANGGTVNLPTNTSVTISFPEVADYKKPADITYTHTGGLVEKSGTYQCELLTVNVSADSGSVSGFEVIIGKQATVGSSINYTQLEYIETTGNQWINTNVIPTVNTRVILDIEILSLVGGPYAIFGERNTTQTSDLFSLWAWDESKFRTDFGAASGNTYLSKSSIGRHLIDKNKNVTTIDGESVTNPTSTINTTYPIYLLSNNYNGNADDRMLSAKVYSCQIYENGNLIRDYIPAKRTDGIVGLYDAVTDSFYPSQGSSNFVAGELSFETLAVQTSVTGSYKIPFGDSYSVKSSRISGYNTPSSLTRIANSKSYTVIQQYTLITEIDLSLQDVYGNPIAQSTANCYVVREVGQYKFPLVYGNAIKNGKVNTAAFTNNGGSNSHDFVNGYRQVITQPYIEYDTQYLDVVEIVNSDENNIITDVSLVDGEPCKYVQFKVNNVPLTGGNVIIWFRTHGEINASLWSWHIWLWPHDLSPVEITNSTGVKYNIMPVNLASKYDSDGVHIKNWFYQWGRPNPMLLPSAWSSTTDHTPGSITKVSKASDLSDGISNPSTFYYNSASPYNWFGTKSYYNLWDAACTDVGASDNDTVKTVYDPCPVGWKVPNGNVFTGFSKSNVVGSFDGGWKFKRYSGDTVGVFFPASGYRSNSDGSLLNVGSEGAVWLSSAYDQGYAYYLSFRLGNVVPKNSSRLSRGLSIRPVQDDNIQLDVIMISFKIDGATYQAERGMTWFEWVYSSYNTIGAIVKANSIMIDGWMIRNNGTAIYPDENITGGHSYGT